MQLTDIPKTLQTLPIHSRSKQPDMKHNLRILCICMMLMLSTNVRAQLSISVLVNPPYPIHIDDYLNYGTAMVITITNTGTSAYDYYLRGSIIGDNGVSLTSNPDVIPSEYLTIGAGQTRLLYGNDIAPFFDFNTSIVTGVDKNTLIRNEALPEGNYDICLDAFEHITNRPLTEVNSCGYFFIRYIQPPIITSPVCASTENYTSPQTVVFSWTPAIGAPATTLYHLKIAEIIPSNRNPFDALHSATTPPFFEQDVYGLTYVYGPGQPPLEQGKSYAFSVTAVDPSGNASFINNGESEVCSFTYGVSDIFSDIVIIQDDAEVVNNFILDGYVVTGQLKYYLSSESNTEYHPFANQPIELRYGQMFVENGTGIKYYYLEQDFQYNVGGAGQNLVVDATTTSSSGAYTFNFDEVGDLGLMSENYTMNIIKNGNKITAVGNVYRVLMVKVIDAHYCNPEFAITEDQLHYGSMFSAEEQYVRARDYTLKYTFSESEDESMMTYYLAGFPSNEEAIFDAGMMNALAGMTADSNPQDNDASFTESLTAIVNNGITTDPADMAYAQAIPADYNGVEDFTAVPTFDVNNEYFVDVFRASLPAGVPAAEGNVDGRPATADGRRHIYHGTTLQKYIEIPGLIKSTSPSDVYILELSPVDKTHGTAKLTYQFRFTYEQDYSVSPPWTAVDAAIYNSDYISPLVPFESTIHELTDATTILSGSMKYMFPDPGQSGLYPFKNQTIKLVKQYGIDKGNGTIEYIPYEGSADQDMYGNLSSIATTTTDGSGNFVFTFSNLTKLGLVDPNADFTIRDHDYYDQYFNDDNSDFGKSEESYPPHHYSGALYCFVRVLTESEYYTNENRVITLMPGESKHLGDAIVPYVRSYSLTVKLSGSGDDDEFNPYALQGMVVKLWRAERPAGVPENEGVVLNPETFLGAEKVAEGVTDANGYVTFTRLVKSFGSNDNYLISAYSSSDLTLNPNSHNYSIWFQDNSWTNTPYGSSKSVDPGDAAKPDQAFWKDDYVYAYVSEELTASPLHPKLSGSVHRSDEVTTPIATVKLSLFNTDPFPMHVVSATNTSSNGNYTLYDYPLMYSGENLLPGALILFGSKEGYNIYAAPDLMPALKYGQMATFNFNMTPGAEVKGRVIDENGDPVKAYVTIGEGADLLTDDNGNFSGPALSYQNQTILVDPISSDYIPTSETYNVNTYNTYDVGDIIVTKIQHHIEITLTESLSGDVIENANVSIHGTGISGKTDNQGKVYFAFENSATSYTIDITGPAGTEWFNKSYSIMNFNGSAYTPYYLTLESATKVEGKVTVNGAPLKDAKVFVDMTGYSTQAFTDNNGHYVLHNVPKRSSLLLKAVKSASDKVGDSTYVNTITNTADVNFELTLFTSIDISKLWGFPIEVEHLTVNAGKVYITGSFINLPDNEHFSADDNAKLHFVNIPIKAGTIKNASNVGYAVPDGISSISFTNTSKLELSLFDKYLVHVGTTSSPVKMENGGTDVGVLKGKVVIDAINFAESTLAFEQSEGIYLIAPGVIDATQKMTLKTLTANAGKPYTATSYTVGDADGNANDFELYGLNFSAATSTSTVTTTDLGLNSTLHTNISSLSQADVNTALGTIHIPAGNVSIPALNGTSKVTLKMQKWNLNATSWTLNNNGLVFNEGSLDAEGLNVPLDAPLYVRETMLQFATEHVFDLASIKLLNAITMQIKGSDQFGYDGSNWQLSFLSVGLTPAATISGLPGMSTGTTFNFDQIWLKSNGERIYQSRSTATNLFGYADFINNPGPISITSTNITFVGSLDLHIPLLSAQQLSLTYSASGGSISGPTLQQFNFTINTNGVVATFDKADKQFKASGFTCSGTLAEPGVFSHYVSLTKNADSCSINTSAGQTFTINASKGYRLTNLRGGMDLTAGNIWSPYSFTGDVNGMPGASGTLTAEVFADIAVNDGVFSVTNLSTPFGDFSLIYDSNIGELTGMLSFAGQISAGLVSIGPISAQMKIGSKGWYFASATAINPLNVPISMVAAMVTGDYPIKNDPYITDLFAQHSVLGTLPQGFQESIKGFYINGSLSPLESIPDISFDFFVASGSLHTVVMADFGFGMNFTDAAIVYLGEGMKFVFHADAGVSAVVGCAHGGFDTEFLMYYSGIYNNATSTFTLAGDAILKVGASLEVGFGCCDSDCEACFDTPLGDSCNNESIGGEVIFSIHASVDTNGDIDTDIDLETIEL